VRSVHTCRSEEQSTPECCCQSCASLGTLSVPHTPELDEGELVCTSNASFVRVFVYVTNSYIYSQIYSKLLQNNPHRTLPPSACSFAGGGPAVPRKIVPMSQGKLRPEVYPITLKIFRWPDYDGARPLDVSCEVRPLAHGFACNLCNSAEGFLCHASTAYVET